jgi:hypothetical protein
MADGTLVSIGVNGQVFVWDAAAAMPLTEYQLSERLAACVALTADGKHIAAGGSDGRLAIFDTIRIPSAATVGE